MEVDGQPRCHIEVNVTKRTIILVIGDGFVGDDMEGFGTGTATKAVMLLQNGQLIEVMSVRDFTGCLTASEVST